MNAEPRSPSLPGVAHDGDCANGESRSHKLPCMGHVDHDLQPKYVIPRTTVD